MIRSYKIKYGVKLVNSKSINYRMFVSFVYYRKVLDHFSN